MRRDRLRSSMKLRLQVSVAFGFTLLVTLVLGVATAAFFFHNRSLAIDTAQRAMADARAESDLALSGIIDPVHRVIAVTAATVAAYPGTVLDRRALGILDAQIGGLDQISGAYVGYADRGAFFQVARITPGEEVFGEAHKPVPRHTTRVMRMVEDDGVSRRETLIFLSDRGEDLLQTDGPAVFDPRTRPWYAAAVASEASVFSAIYTFSGSGRRGVTLARRLLDENGNLLGVVGADMSIRAITETLARIRVDGVGEIFLADPEGNLITSSERAGGATATPLAEAAMQAAADQEAKFFRFTPPGSTDRYLVSLAPASRMLNARPVLGVIVPERHFTGAIVDTTFKVLQISGLIALLAVLLTVLLARLLSMSLARVADEARRIGAFDLTGDFKLSSRIAEVADLGAAIANMKNSLLSFGAFVPREVVRTIVADGGRVAVGGVEREVTLLFSDIERFTAKSERMPPETVMRDLSRYFTTMEEAIGRHGGTIDKYIGDAVMALWNAPTDDPAHAEHACRAALACRRAERLLQAEAGSASLFPSRTRFGLHCDRVIVGNVGSANRMQYTALGGAVNLGSRVEGLNKIFGTDILVTQALVDRVGDRFLFRPVDFVSPAGTTQPVALYELIGELAPDAENPVTTAQRAEVAAWVAALTLYRARSWQQALAAFQALRELGSPDHLTRLYIKRASEFLANPPPPDWDGVHVFAEK